MLQYKVLMELLLQHLVENDFDTAGTQTKAVGVEMLTYNYSAPLASFLISKMNTLIFISGHHFQWIPWALNISNCLINKTILL